MGVNSSECPSFVKVYSSSERMLLPHEFIRSLPDGIANMLFLRNRSGVRQSVELSLSGNDVFLEGVGWDQFVRDNNLVEGQFLVFSFNNVDTFDFKIYRSNGSEKVDEGEEEEFEETYVQVDEINEAEEEEEEEKGKKKRRKGKGIVRNMDRYGYDIFKSGKFVQPENPYFVTKVRRGRHSMLYIPLEVEKVLGDGLPEKLNVGDSRGRSYTLEIKRWEDGRKWYKGEWRRLCEVNMVGDDDRLVCEFIKRDEQQSYEMQVHIVRCGTTSNRSSE